MGAVQAMQLTSLNGVRAVRDGKYLVAISSGVNGKEITSPLVLTGCLPSSKKLL